MLTPEQLVAANKAGLDALVELTRKSFEGIEKLVELNLRMVRMTLGDGAVQARALMTASDAASLASAQAGLVQPAAEKAGAYSRELCEIAVSTQREVNRLVEAQLAAAQQRILAMVDTAVKNAPADPADSAEVVRTAVTAASSAMEIVQKAAREAVDHTGAQVEAIMSPQHDERPARRRAAAA